MSRSKPFLVLSCDNRKIIKVKSHLEFLFSFLSSPNVVRGREGGLSLDPLHPFAFFMI